jgi:hypothetical protein
MGGGELNPYKNIIRGKLVTKRDGYKRLDCCCRHINSTPVLVVQPTAKIQCSSRRILKKQVIAQIIKKSPPFTEP